MNSGDEISHLKELAAKARDLFVEDAKRAITKCYNIEASNGYAQSALRWKQIADGLETAASRKYSKLCDVEA